MNPSNEFNFFNRYWSTNGFQNFFFNHLFTKYDHLYKRNHFFLGTPMENPYLSWWLTLYPRQGGFSGFSCNLQIRQSKLSQDWYKVYFYKFRTRLQLSLIWKKSLRVDSTIVVILPIFFDPQNLRWILWEGECHIYKKLLRRLDIKI